MRDREDDDDAQQNHWSECGRATSLYNPGAPSRPHRSVLSLGFLTCDMKSQSATVIRILKASAWLGLAAVTTFAAPFSDIGFDAASKRAAQTGKIVLVDFYTTWCAPCRLLDKRTWTDPGVIKALEEKTVALRVDAEKETDLARRYQIEAYPSILLIKPDGTELDRLVGYRDPKTFLADFGAALKGRDAATRAKEKRVSAGTNDPMARMESARSLATKGQDAQALEEYLWCFDHGSEARPSFALMQVSLLLDRIKDLASRYPAAQRALESRRDERQTKLLSGTIDQQAATELVRLNEVLGQKERNLAVFDRLPTGSPARDAVISLLINQFLDAKRYADVLGGTDGKSAFAQQVVLFNEMVDALNPKNPDKSLYEESYRRSTVAWGAHFLQALAGLNKNQQARELAQQILKFDASAATRSTLAEAAARAGNVGLADYVKQ